ncbi:basic proline-rich protein-like isoform X4 [Cyanistes caeruleus]|uniref:basic proline-rich protein-like isoform X4 n=1 Tax=Cyanistes caeruleus TaxID=156563 RepID=UPI000CDB965E|nr:basic proline-rich protein-like isoform X4 [Cyanistes caeruleus]
MDPSLPGTPTLGHTKGFDSSKFLLCFCFRFVFGGFFLVFFFFFYKISSRSRSRPHPPSSARAVSPLSPKPLPGSEPDPRVENPREKLWGTGKGKSGWILGIPGQEPIGPGIPAGIAPGRGAGLASAPAGAVVQIRAGDSARCSGGAPGHGPSSGLAGNAPNPPRDAPNPPRDALNPPRDAPNPPRDAPNPPRDAPNPPRDAPNPPWGTLSFPWDAPSLPQDAPNPPRDAPNPPWGTPSFLQDVPSFPRAAPSPPVPSELPAPSLPLRPCVPAGREEPGNPWRARGGPVPAERTPGFSSQARGGLWEPPPG